MTDYRRLISLSVEIEGLLRILENRADDTAAALLGDKYAEFKGFMDELTAEPVENFAEPEREQEADVVDAWAQEPMPEPETEPEPVAEPEPEAEPEPAVEPQPTARTPRKPEIGKHLTLNDKYGFVRDVFNGDEADFQATLDVIGEMTSPEDAADYIVGDLMLDADNDSVRKFMEFIEKCFE
ncbi:MAG: hypothetical protein K2J38_00790 [Muribaculaceae bacterium]|nr:hypothetical protein [Muribaculaceae bacterium]